MRASRRLDGSRPRLLMARSRRMSSPWIKHTECAAKSAADAAERARKRALDLTPSANDVADARRAMDDAAFKRDRL
jgi:hypothetical protein